MLRSIEGIIDEQGNVRLLEPVRLPCARRAIVTILEDEPGVGFSDMTLVSEPVLAEDWNRPEEEAAWSHLQQVR